MTPACRHDRSMPASPAAPGFSLIELLTVLAVVAVLIALLLPTLRTARQAARQATCASNLHQLHLGFTTARTSGVTAGGRVHTANDLTWVSWSLPGVNDDARAYLCPSDTRPEEARSAGGGVGDVTVIEVLDEAPPSLEDDALSAADRAFLIPERKALSLGGGTAVDVTQPGTYTINDAGGGTVPADGEVNTWLVHFDPTADGWVRVNASVSFSGEVLGIIIETDRLNATDGQLGAPGTTYATGNQYRGYEYMGNPDKTDFVTLDPSRRLVNFNFATRERLEEVRVITRPGGAAYSSYGVNNQVADMPAERQVLLADYGKLVIDRDGSDGLTDGPEDLRLRHRGRANVLFGDGSVRGGFDETFFAADQPHWDAR